MRILFLTRALTMGGIETNLLLLSAELQSRGHEVSVVSGEGRLIADFRALGVRHVLLRMSPRDLLRDVAVLRHTLVDSPPDVIHIFSASSAVLLWLALHCPLQRRIRPEAVPVISTIMGLHTHPEEPLWRVMARVYMTAFGADRVVTIAPAIDRLVRRLPIRRSRVVRGAVVGVLMPSRFPSDSGQAVLLRKELGVAPSDSVVMTIGGLLPRKSHELFLRMAAAVLSRRSDVRFFIIGGGPLQPALEDEIDQLGIASHVRLLGERTDLTSLLSITDVYVRPGVVEGFVGLTVLHAQALAVPVVSFVTEDVRLAIIDGVTGLLVPKGDIAGLAAKVMLLLQDIQLASHIAQEGRTHVKQHFALPAVADGIEALYREETARRT